jgi:tetratricopeptide (TPR) repeat protein
MIFFDLNDFKSAKNEIKKLLEDFPDTDFRFDALFCMGNILMSQGDYLSSKSEFLKIINSKSPAGAPEEIVQKAEERLNQIEKWLKNRNDSQQLVNNWGKYRDAYNYHAKLIMQIATGRVVEPEEIHRAFENVRKYRELYEKQLSGRDSVNNKALTEKARKEYYSSYEKYINLVKDLSPDEYDRPEIHEALEEYQKNKKKYLNLKLEKDDVEKDDLKDTDNSSGRLFHKLQDSGSEEIINSREQIF